MAKTKAPTKPKPQDVISNTKADVTEIIDQIEPKNRLEPKEIDRVFYLYNHIFHHNHSLYKVHKLTHYSPESGCGSCLRQMISDLRGFIGYPTMNQMAEKNITQFRYEVCQKCPFAKKKNFFGIESYWCGTPFLGQKVTHNGNKIKLCGCNTFLKTKFKNESCPASKWR